MARRKRGEAESGGGLDNDACIGLREAARVATQRYDERLKPGGLKVTQFSVLAALYYSPGIAVSKLADRLVLDRTTLTRNLRVLTRDGLVKLAGSLEDKRERCVFLTDRGYESLIRCLPYWREAQAEAVGRLGSTNWDRLRGMLRKTVSAAQADASQET
jgi:DNA-binding MarR family transcriptional regulator